MGTGKKESLSDSACTALLAEAPAAIAALRKIRDAADVAGETCDSCGLHKKRCFRDAQLAAMLGGIENKLSGWLKEARAQSGSPDPRA